MDLREEVKRVNWNVIQSLNSWNGSLLATRAVNGGRRRKKVKGSPKRSGLWCGIWSSDLMQVTWSLWGLNGEDVKYHIDYYSGYNCLGEIIILNGQGRRSRGRKERIVRRRLIWWLFLSVQNSNFIIFLLDLLSFQITWCCIGNWTEVLMRRYMERSLSLFVTIHSQYLEAD